MFRKYLNIYIFIVKSLKCIGTKLNITLQY